MSRKLFACYLMGHFWVDLACAFLAFRSVAGREDAVRLFLLYNACAFAAQLPLGPVVDFLDRNHLVAAAGCVMAAAAFALPAAPAVCVAGLGNGLFHLGGGVDVLNASTERTWKLGAFISPGAVGLYLGTVWGSGSDVPCWPVSLALASTALMIWSCGWFAFRGGPSGNEPFDPSRKSPAWVLAAIFLVVAIRSYMALAPAFGWKADWRWAAASVFALALGKTAGGFLADRFGLGRTAAATLGAAACLYSISALPLPGTIAAFLFNMSMPLTMWMAAKAFPGAKGMAFGALSFALFVGYIPAGLDLYGLGAGPAACVCASMVSLALLLAAIRGRTGPAPSGKGV